MGVAFFHAGPWIYPDYSPEKEAYYWFFSGRIGVDIFFMISGFVMYVTESEHARSGARAALDFFVKRLIRVAPMYWLATVIVYNFGTYEINTCGIWHSVLFVPETPDINPEPAPFFCYPKLFVGWTLNYEMWFYVAFALSLLFGRWRSPMVFLIVTAPMLFSWAHTGRVDLHSWYGTGYQTAWFSMIANPLLLEFLAGIGLGMMYQSRIMVWGTRAGKVALAMAGVFFVYVYVLGYLAVQTGGAVWLPHFLTRMINYRTAHGILNAGLCCFVLFFLILVYEKNCRVPMNGFFKKLADASYLIYLLHTLILHFVMKELEFLHDSIAAYMWVYVIVLVLASLLLHITIEAPLTRWLRRILLPRKPTALNAA